MKQLLVKFALFVIRAVVDKSLLAAAQASTKAIENRWAGNGSAKRYAVYEELVAKFPAVSKQLISLVIEAVLEQK